MKELNDFTTRLKARKAQIKNAKVRTQLRVSCVGQPCYMVLRMLDYTNVCV